MSRSTISTFQLFQMFTDEGTARVYLEGRPWHDGTACPTCAGKDRIPARKRLLPLPRFSIEWPIWSLRIGLQRSKNRRESGRNP